MHTCTVDSFFKSFSRWHSVTGMETCGILCTQMLRITADNLKNSFCRVSADSLFGLAVIASRLLLSWEECVKDGKLFLFSALAHLLSHFSVLGHFIWNACCRI